MGSDNESQGTEELWVVSFADDDDRELKIPQIVAAIRQGLINTDTIVWREGMDDWLPIAQVPEIADSLGRKKTAPPPKPKSVVPEATSKRAKPTAESDDDEAPVSIEPDSVESARPAAVALSAGTLFTPESLAKEAGAKGGKALPAPPKASKPDWAKAVAQKKGSAAEDDSEEAAPVSSGTPDLRALTRDLESNDDDRPPDSLVNLGRPVGGGALLAPPTIDVSDLGAPTIDPTAPPDSEAPKKKPKAKATSSDDSEPKPKAKAKKKPAKAVAAAAEPDEASDEDEAPDSTVSDRPKAKQPEQKKGSAMVWVAIAAIAAAVVVFLVVRPSGSDATKGEADDTESTASDDQAKDEKAGDQAEVEKTGDQVEDEKTGDQKASDETEEEKADNEKAGDEANTANLSPEELREKYPWKAGEQGGSKPSSQTKPAEEKPAEGKPAEEKPAEEKPAEEKPAEAPSLPPFDKGAAAAALGSAAGQASSCRQEGDPSGTATVIVTFAPSGRVTSANVTGPPFAGTRTGGCIAATMRRAQVPAFSGSHVTVSKTVNIH